MAMAGGSGGGRVAAGYWDLCGMEQAERYLSVTQEMGALWDVCLMATST